MSGFTFKPIHNFVPQINKIKFEGGANFDTNSGIQLDSGKFLKAFGPERYLSLASSTSEVSGSNNVNTKNNNYGGEEGQLIDGAENYIPTTNL